MKLINNPMKKRGQIVEGIGVVVFIGLIIIGSVSTSKVLSENRYVGNNLSNNYYDLSSCVITIPLENLVVFSDKQDAESRGFKSAGCNR